jgi:hypothetical protein
MRRFAAAMAALLLLASAARAQVTAAPGTYTFTAVDAVMREVGYLTITGLREGEAAPTTHRLPLGPMPSSGGTTNPSDIGESCERKALLAMSKPGAYVLRLEVHTYYTSYFTKCTLARAVP